MTADLLREARALYAAHPSHAPSGETPDPETWCLVQALDEATRGVVTEGGEYSRMTIAMRCAANPMTSLVTWNAEHTTEEVLAAFDRAIAAEEAKA